jgi:hypothetical protein
MKRKTIYEWRFEETIDGVIVDVCATESNSPTGLLMGELEDYGSDNRDDLEPYWEVCLNKRVWDWEEGDILEEDWFYLELVDGKFQFSSRCNEPPKRFKAQVEKLNKELA